MIADFEMKHKPKTVMGTMRNLVPDLVNVNMEKLPFTCNLNHRKQQKNTLFIT